MIIEKATQEGVHLRVRQALAVYKKHHQGKIHPSRMHTVEQVEDTLDIITDARQVYDALQRIILTIPSQRKWLWMSVGKPSVLRCLLEEALRATKDGERIELLESENRALQAEIAVLKKDIFVLQSDHAQKIIQLTREHHKELHQATQELASMKHEVQRQLQHQGTKLSARGTLSF